MIKKREKRPRGFQAHPPRRDREARNALAVRWLDLVPWAIYQKRPHLRRFAHVIGHADAIQVGNIALLRAAELWDESKGKFSTYATVCVRGAVIGAARRIRDRVVLCERLIDCLDRDEEAPTVSRLDMRSALSSVLNTLTYRQRTILELRYGLNKDGHTYTLEEVGRIFKVTGERIRTIEGTAIRKLLHPRRARILAAALGLRACKRCPGWTEWDTNCPLCNKPGCERCVCLRYFHKDAQPVRCCATCKEELKAAYRTEGWENYTPFLV